ncbi:MAG: ASCH domain-containing protein [Ilumatobacteraceae bacterium]
MFERIDGMRTIEFGTPGPSREKLVTLILHGQKRATAGLLIGDYESEGEPIEHVGELLAIVDNDGKHVGTMKVTRAEIMRFADVPDEFAIAEAEGDMNTADFRASHLAYWTRVGETVTDDTLIVTVYFDLLPETSPE